MAAEEPFADGFAALAEGRREQARSALETGLARGETETAEPCFGLAMALWWLGENQACVERCSRAYAPAGMVAVLVPAGLDAQPGYGPFVDVVARHAGPEARSLLSTYFACGDLGELTGWFGQAGLRVTAADTHSGRTRFPSADALVSTEVESTPLGERITAEVYGRIRHGAREVLAPFTAADGTLDAPFTVHVVAARR
jgi:hypothetical protein